MVGVLCGRRGFAAAAAGAFVLLLVVTLVFNEPKKDETVSTPGIDYATTLFETVGTVTPEEEGFVTVIEDVFPISGDDGEAPPWQGQSSWPSGTDGRIEDGMKEHPPDPPSTAPGQPSLRPGRIFRPERPDFKRNNLDDPGRGA